ncbi:hypothetical protein GCM10011386_07750 [Parapedobacter defluvii]|uniref:Uncharacterized protein n=1 Tax=Parapedobacter defluvii TaxID=2045106 RepID=A0ABQ1L8B2_9SPHI|nr:hypothetical protein GCM10011386_07750 [Parapedobacter defluvii]
MKYLITLLLLACGYISIAQIKPYNESASYFKQPTQIDTTRGNFSTKDMYRAYRRAGTGFTSMTKTQRRLENRIAKFAKSKGKSFIVLGSQFSQPPYILGNYPRMEIIFVLVD